MWQMAPLIFLPRLENMQLKDPVVYRTSISSLMWDGVLTVSNKKKQGILFDQELKNIPATSPPILLNGHSIDLDSNQTTGLPLYYEVEDDQVAVSRSLQTPSSGHTGNLMRQNMPRPMTKKEGIQEPFKI